MKFIKNIFTYLFILIFANLSAQYFPKKAPKNLEQKAEKYADSLYQQLSLDEKIGQLYIVALYNNRGVERPESAEYPGAHRRGPAYSRGLHRAAWGPHRIGRLLAD